MRLVRLGPLVALMLALAALAPVAADEPEPEVVFYAPSELEPAWGNTEVEVDVYADGVDELIFLVDGDEVARLRRRPWKITVPLGDTFESHSFEVIALGDGRELVRGTLDTPPLRIDDQIDLGLQQLYVTIDASSGNAAGLEASDFRVFDDGMPQKIVTFERGDAALTVALLIDASESMRGGHLEAALGGVRAFLEGMRDLDEAALYLFADSLRSRSPFLERAEALERELGSVAAAGGTAIHDSLYLAIRQLESRQGRRVVVLLSDGFDIHSALDIEKVLWAMRRSRSLVYWIELGDAGAEVGRSSPWKSFERHRSEREGLRRLVEESGGRVVPLETVSAAAVAFDDILTELRSQYVLGYYPTRVARDGRWHPVDVKVARKGHRVRTRGGYVAD